MMTSRWIKIVYAALFAVSLCLPMFYRLTKALPQRAIQNVTVNHSVPKLEYGAFLDGTFQRRFEKWFMQHSGLWGALVTTHNSMNYRLFREISTSYGGEFMLGRDFNIFQRLYLKDVNGDIPLKEEDVVRTAKQLKEIQDYFAARGRSVLVLFSANKLALYPDIVSPRYLKANRQQRNIDVYRREFDALGVRYVDSSRTLAGLKARLPYPLFAKSAAHWNEVAACEVAAALVDAIQEGIGRAMRRPNCSVPLRVEERPQGSDHDLANVINVWSAAASDAPTPYITPDVTGPTDAYRPKVLFDGTSYLWSIFEVLDPLDILQRRDFYYYSKTNHFREGAVGTSDAVTKGSRSIRLGRLNWDSNVFDRDAIVIEINEARVHQIGFGFIRELWEEIQKKEGKPLPKVKKKRRHRGRPRTTPAA